jgi:hypothetical protein
MKRFKKLMIMTTLQKFTVWIPTEFGLGCQTIKGKDFTDAFLRLGKKDKLKRGLIEDESGESITFHEILGIEL